MSRELIIGIVVSALVHGGFFFGGESFHKEEVVAAVVEEEAVIEVLEMPPIEPEEPEIYEDTTDEAPPEELDFAPPMQTDVPSVAIDTPFVQKLQPPPPPWLERPHGIITIPMTSATRNIGAGLKYLLDLTSFDLQKQ